MSEKPFRKSSLERVNSPEQLNEYIRVARPGVWITLAAVVLLLVGVVVWGVAGRVETTVDAAAVVQGGQATLYIGANDAPRVEAGMRARIDGETIYLPSPSEPPVPLGELADAAQDAVRQLVGDPCVAVRTAAPGVPDGVFAAQIVVESLRPIQFVTQ